DLHQLRFLPLKNSNLHTVGFGINARFKFNQRNFHAGKNYNIIMNQVEREAKELAFNVPGETGREDIQEPKGVSFCGWANGKSRGEGTH
ncbi:hypothetical protein Tsubulata_028645, partial [Turnera subulata]